MIRIAKLLGGRVSLHAVMILAVVVTAMVGGYAYG